MVKAVYNLPEEDADDETAIHHWLASLNSHYPEEQIRHIADACSILQETNAGQRLETGETHVRYILSTADILASSLQMDYESLIAALLNGCLHIQEYTEERITGRFGATVARMVGDLHRIGQLANIHAMISAKDRPEHEENLRRLLLGISEDVRVVLIVLAERLHLMRSIKHLDRSRQTRIARDTERVYAPLANRLGIWQIKWELEDLSLRYLEPEEYKRIARSLAERREEREEYIASVIEILREKFATTSIKAEISGRPKHIYSIWKKMRRKGLDIQEIFDLRAVRIMVNTVADCYAALGIVHGLWRHIPKEFDDYIATPKGNMYQSLHTAVIGPGDKSLEVQIRTYDMHRHAEFGIAAHWAYKEAKGHDAEFQRRLVWMRNWLTLKNELDDPEEYLDRFRSEFEPSHIYVLTPQSKVIQLPRGATPLDFAYAIHSEVGNHCRGARINGRIVPLNCELNSGDSVEILTQKNGTPSRDWLSPHTGYLTTNKARNRVRQWFKQQDLEQNAHEGKIALERELDRLGIEEKPDFEELNAKFNFKRSEDLLAAIGRGDLAVGQVARQIGEPRNDEPKEPEHKPRPAPQRSSSSTGDIIVEGVGDLMTQIAQCCKPVPYDDIIGYVTRGRGVTIHRTDCSNILHLPAEEAERLIDVRWADHPSESSYAVNLLVIASDRKGLLRDVSSTFSDEDIDVIGVETHSEKSTFTASMRFSIEVRNMDQLAHIMTRLQQIPDVQGVRRTY